MYIILIHLLFYNFLNVINTCYELNFLLIKKSLFFPRNLGKTQKVLLTHGDCIERVADTFSVVATSSSFIVGIANNELRLYGLQFHPEVIYIFNCT